MENDTALQYIGFINTPNLWENDVIKKLQQFEVSKTIFQINNPKNFNEIRLGKRVEQFLNFQISQIQNFELLAANIQIKQEKQTIGELDALVLNNNQLIHLETVYKFYLYDDSIQSINNLDKWIGPNRNDTFSYKIKKLINKQLPLLFNKATLKMLGAFDLKNKTIVQNVCFKAQLFLPFDRQSIRVCPFNDYAVYGFYISINKIEQLNSYQFYIPRKLNWLVEPQDNVEWLNFEMSVTQLNALMDEKRSPMVWLKSKDGTLSKCFVTWW
jgi:hypothetical protein